MTISKKVEQIISKSSWIRKMFEEGARLKAEHGKDNVFDFSIGNPNLQPPDEFQEALEKTAMHKIHGRHSYMPNAGLPDVREKIAEFGALNVIFKTIINPGDEIICPSPFFVEYTFYADNHGGVLKTVPTNSDFTLNLESIEEAIGDKTKAVLINSPNNPTGQIYSAESLKKLGDLLEKKSRELNRCIYLISDEPYRKIIFDDVTVPSIFKAYKESIVITSYSKDLSIPGERIGFLAVNPACTHKTAILSGAALSNRILGFVNAPALMQRVLAKVQGFKVDIGQYKRKRDLFCKGLAECGYEFLTPPGAFYLFPKCPISDDVKFVRALQEELILAVPGSGFGGPGYFRLAFCVEDQSIIDAMPGFAKVIKNF
ncbi:MAG: aspartate aminotransferase [Desulfobacteraceae bacterium 4572_19]|nr:MAG: aspartate aminotransferase [Desulfobacteraceae bacterium 4572_19]